MGENGSLWSAVVGIIVTLVIQGLGVLVTWGRDSRREKRAAKEAAADRLRTFESALLIELQEGALKLPPKLMKIAIARAERSKTGVWHEPGGIWDVPAMGEFGEIFRRVDLLSQRLAADSTIAAHVARLNAISNDLFRTTSDSEGRTVIEQFVAEASALSRRCGARLYEIHGGEPVPLPALAALPAPNPIERLDDQSGEQRADVQKVG